MPEPTNDELREEIRETLDVPEYLAGSSGLRSVTLEKAVEEVGGDPWGGAPSLRGQLRTELGLVDDSEHDPSGLRKADLLAIRDALRGDRDA